MALKEHCCDGMRFFLNEGKVQISYSPERRRYSILLYSNARQLIYYCPWCGKKFPKDLSKEWFEILEKEYGIECPFDEEERHKIPKEFQTDKWWKKRGL